jgi:hypothetical protein
MSRQLAKQVKKTGEFLLLFFSFLKKPNLKFKLATQTNP